MEIKYIIIIACSLIAIVLISTVIMAKNMKRLISGTIIEIDSPKGNDNFVLATLLTKNGNEKIAIDTKILACLQKGDYVILCKKRIESTYDKIDFIQKQS